MFAMSTHIKLAISLSLIALFALSPTTPVAAPPSFDEQLRYQIWLDKREVGTHEVAFAHEGDRLIVNTRVNMRIRALFIDVFKYQHEAYEEWQGNCLQTLTSSTSANGKQFAVEALTATQADPCPATFAYWDLGKLQQQSSLVNTQTGEAIPVTLTPMGRTPVPRSNVQADTYVLTNKLGDITLWYSADQRWLALQTETRGRTLTYLAQELTEVAEL